MRNNAEAHCSTYRSALLDSSSFEVICTVARRSLLCRYRGVPTDIIQDAVQEAACKLYEQNGLRSEVNPRTVYSWMFTTASRELGHTLRRYWRNTAAAIEADASGTVAAFSGLRTREQQTANDSMSDELTDQMTCSALLSYLSDSLAEAVRLHFEGYTAEEIAQRLGCTRAAAYKRVQRACYELRELWKKEECRADAMVV